MRKPDSISLKFLAGVLASSALLIASCAPKAPETPSTVNSTAEPWQSRVEAFKDLKRDHVAQPVSYAMKPPVGGPHTATWQSCGFYENPVKNEAAVHSLEHGAAWFTWKTELTRSQKEFVQNLVSQSSWVLATPYPSQESPYVLSAWGLQLELESFDRKAIAGFIKTYANGKQTPEPGAPCKGGINTSGK